VTDRDAPPPDPHEQACDELVEMVTDYLEEALPADERARIDRHLTICDGCRTVLAQWHDVIRLTGRLAEADVDRADPGTRDRLLATFRQHRPR
jgi:anti-sigma factor RsiW